MSSLILKRFLLPIWLLLACISIANAAIVVGNPKGSVTLSFIYDYTCPHCHKMYALVGKLIKSDPDLRVKLYPAAVIAPESTPITAMVIASTQTGKFRAFSDALMSLPTPIQASEYRLILKKLGLDSDSFEKSAHADWVREQMMQPLKIMNMVGMREVPLFLVHVSNGKGKTEVLNGEQSIDTLTNAISNVKKG